MKTFYGNIVNCVRQGTFDIIVHGCNCFHTMGSGVALQLKENFPEVFAADLTTKCGDHTKLGSSSIAIVPNQKGTNTFVVNAYTQYAYGTDKRHVSYDAIDTAFRELAVAVSNDLFYGAPSCPTIAYPKIGAGLGGGQWNIIHDLIESALTGLDHTVIIYQP